jgi:CheY-like chemotaxis protein
MKMVSCLLIEPDARERAHVKGLLDSLGMNCVASSQADALNATEGDVPDVIVMEVSSLPAAKRFLKLRGQRRTEATGKTGGPVLLMYGRSTGIDVINESILNGVAEFLVQPFDRELLRFKLSQSGVLPRKAA